MSASSLAGAEGTVITAEQALQRLIAGNEAFLTGGLTLQKKATAAVRQALSKGQKPFAIVSL